MENSLLFVLFSFLLLAAAAERTTSSSNASSGMQMKLIHVVYSRESPMYNDSLSSIDKLRSLMLMDEARLLHLSQRFHNNSSSSSSSKALSLTTTTTMWAKSPMESGAFLGLGQYLVSISFGSPPQSLLLIADTGSDLVWLQCSSTPSSSCDRRHHPNPSCPSSKQQPVFFATKSSSFAPIPCAAHECLLVPAPPHDPPCNLVLPSPCAYSYGYADRSTTTGFLATDTATIANSSSSSSSTSSSSGLGCCVRVENVAFGCGTRNVGASFAGAGGVLGLGQGDLSFAVQAGAMFGHTFSYCLVDYLADQQQQHEERKKEKIEETTSPSSSKKKSSFLYMGKRGDPSSSWASSRPPSPSLTYTPLVRNPFAPTFYYVSVAGVRVGGSTRPLLPISNTEWSIDLLGNGGTVVDSGSTLSFLRLPAYLALLDAFARSVRLPRISASASLFQGLELCYNISSSSSSSSRTRPRPRSTSYLFPQLEMVLEGGLSLEPPASNYFVDVAEDVKCLAFRPTLSPFGFNVVGNLLQQGYHVEFDRGNSRIGFARTDCEDFD